MTRRAADDEDVLLLISSGCKKIRTDLSAYDSIPLCTIVLMMFQVMRNLYYGTDSQRDSASDYATYSQGVTQ